MADTPQNYPPGSTVPLSDGTTAVWDGSQWVPEAEYKAAQPGFLAPGGEGENIVLGAERGAVRGVADIANIPGGVFTGVVKGLDWASNKLGRPSDVASTIPDWVSHDYGQDIRNTAGDVTGIDLGKSKGAGVIAEDIGRSLAPAAITGSKQLVESAIKYGAIPTAAGSAAANLLPEDKAEVGRVIAELAAGGIMAGRRTLTGSGASRVAATPERQVMSKGVATVATMTPEKQQYFARETLKNPQLVKQFSREEQVVLAKIAQGNPTAEWLAKLGEGSKLKQIWTGIGAGGTMAAGAAAIGMPTGITSLIGGAGAAIGAGKAIAGTVGSQFNKAWLTNKLSMLDQIIRGGTPPNQAATRIGGAGAVISGANEPPISQDQP